MIVLQLAFDGIGSMPMARIENYRQVKQEAVEFEMKRRNARKNLDHALITSPADSKVMQVEGEIYMPTLNNSSQISVLQCSHECCIRCWSTL